MGNSEEKVVCENNERTGCHKHCGNNNIFTIIAIILSVIAIGMSAYTLGVCSNKNVRVKNNAKQNLFQEQMATESYIKRCPMCNQCFYGKFKNRQRNFGNRNWRKNRDINNQTRWGNFRDNNWQNYFGNEYGRQYDGYNWENFNSDYMNGWKNRNSNNNFDNNDNDGSKNNDTTNDNRKRFNRNNADSENNWWNNDSRNRRRQNDNRNDNITPGSLPKINGNDQAPNIKDEDIKQPLPISPKVDVR